MIAKYHARSIGLKKSKNMIGKVILIVFLALVVFLLLIGASTIIAMLMIYQEKAKDIDDNDNNE